MTGACGPSRSSADEESDAASAASEPPNWNSDDEPPEDHVGDEHTCSRDGLVKKVIERIGHGLAPPGQYDRVHVRYQVTSASATDTWSDAAVPDGPEAIGQAGECAASVDTVVYMGEDQLPLAIEFALKCMRLDETAEVTGPPAYASKSSPIFGHKLRNGTGHLPPQGKVSRKLRFLPAAPREIAEQARREKTDTGADGASVQSFRAKVELLAIDSIHMLTEDRRISKQLLSPGHGRRSPRIGDLVTFSYSLSDDEHDNSLHSSVLDDRKLPFEGLERVLISMKEGERCLARLPPCSQRIGDEDANDQTMTFSKNGALPSVTSGDSLRGPTREGPQNSLSLYVTLHCWRCRDSVLVPPPGAGNLDASAGDCAVECPKLQKFELRRGPERLAHDVEHGCMVLVGLARCAEPGSQSSVAATIGQTYLLSWCLGEGCVPGYLEAGIAGMRLAESAVFHVPREAIAFVQTGPSYPGQTPLRRLEVPELDAAVGALFDDSGHLQLAQSKGDDSSSWPTKLCEWRPPANWMNAGISVLWNELEFEQPVEGTLGISFKLTLLAATESPDVCMMSDEAQHAYLEKERGHGNSLAKLGRFAEASLAYSKALDAVRRTPLYKALFPTERGRIQGAYSRDPGETESPLEQLSSADVDAWRVSLVALHLNLALCAVKEKKPALARRHSTAALGADPKNSKALFRRGSAAAAQGDHEEALRDLQQAAELEPQDRVIREELQSLHRSMRQHREAEKSMFQNSFKPPARESTAGSAQPGDGAASETPPQPGVPGVPE